MLDENELLWTSILQLSNTALQTLLLCRSVVIQEILYKKLPAMWYTRHVPCRFINQIWQTNSGSIYWLHNYSIKNSFIFKSLGVLQALMSVKRFLFFFATREINNPHHCKCFSWPKPEGGRGGINKWTKLPARWQTEQEKHILWWSTTSSPLCRNMIRSVAELDKIPEGRGAEMEWFLQGVKGQRVLSPSYTHTKQLCSAHGAQQERLCLALRREGWANIWDQNPAGDRRDKPTATRAPRQPRCSPLI